MIKLAVHNCLPYSSAQSLPLPFQQAKKKKRKHEDDELSFPNVSAYFMENILFYNKPCKSFGLVWGKKCQRKCLTCLICTYTLHSLHYGDMIPHSGRVKAAELIVEFLPTSNEHFLIVPLDANLCCTTKHHEFKYSTFHQRSDICCF